MIRTLILYFCLQFLAPGATCQEDDLLVQTRDGPIRGGYRKTGSGFVYKSFQEIPFAAPPVGSLRFGAPQPVEPWTEERDVSGYSVRECVQFGYLYEGDVEVKGNEDCLYLSVYTPKNATKGDKLPVMFWIFGGYFVSGQNAFWAYGPDNYVERDVIMVQPNHRLGPFGFTDLGIPEAPGNQGLRDLVAALEWVNANIEEFGGDPESVTIFGESSGSWACSYLHLTPYANGLFSRVIMESGTMLNPFWGWKTESDAVRLASYMSERFNCTDLSPYGQLECLQALPKEVLEPASQWGTAETLGIMAILRPTGIVDGDFIPDTPTKLLERGEYNHVDVIIGVTKDEGLLQMVNFVLDPNLYLYAALMWDNLGPMFLFGRTGSYDVLPHDKSMTTALTNHYLGSRFGINEKHFQNMTDMISDAYIWYGSHKHAEYAAANGDNVYQYQFNFKGPWGYLDSYGVDSELYGVAHSDELWYLWNIYFGVYYVNNRTEDIAYVSNSMLEMWTNFGKTGNPTPADSNLVPWDPVTPGDHRYLIIDTEMKMDCTDDYLSRMKIWEDTYIYPEGDTIPPEGIKVDEKDFMESGSDVWKKPKPLSQEIRKSL